LALQSDPIFPVYNENGNLGIADTGSVWNNYLKYNPVNLWNPYATTRFTNKKNKSYNTLAQAFIEYDIVKGLKIKTDIDANLSTNFYNYYKFKNQGFGFNQDLPTSSGNVSSGRKLNWLWQNTVTYNFSVNRSRFTLLGGYTVQKERTQFQSMNAANYPNDLVQTLNAGTITGGTSTVTEWAMQSYLARVNYSLMDRYYFSASLRGDGSSRFSIGNQWGNFASVSLGWVISDESFLSRWENLNLLKLRVSLGSVGNNQIPDFGSIGLLGKVNYASSNNLASGLIPISMDNSDLSWEKTTQANIGLDISAFKNRLTASLDIYRSVTKDMLLNLPIPDITGFSTQLTNIGRMRNNGIEIYITSKNIRNNKFQWETNFNFSLNRNKVLQLGPNNAPLLYTQFQTTSLTSVGRPVFDFYGYKFDGVYNNMDEIKKSPHEASTRPGDPIIADVNGDGKITTDDRTIIGNNQPNFIAGITNTFSYKDFDLSFLVQWHNGGEIANQSYRFLGFWNSGRNLYASSFHYWRSESDPGDGVNPRPSVNRRPFQQAFSTLWVESASFVRIKNVMLSYDIPSKVIHNTPFTDLNVYINADNVKLFSNYRGYDPENTTYTPTDYQAGLKEANTGTSSTSFPAGSMLGMDYGSYPIPLTITFGLRASF